MLATAHARAPSRALPLSIDTMGLFTIGDGRASRAAVQVVARDALDLVGLAVHGSRNGVDKVLEGARMHP